MWWAKCGCGRISKNVNAVVTDTTVMLALMYKSTGYKQIPTQVRFNGRFPGSRDQSDNLGLLPPLAVESGVWKQIFGYKMSGFYTGVLPVTLLTLSKHRRKLKVLTQPVASFLPPPPDSWGKRYWSLYTGCLTPVSSGWSKAERRSWTPYNCRRAFPGLTQPLMVRAGWDGSLQLTVGPQFFRVPGPQNLYFNHCQYPCDKQIQQQRSKSRD